MPSLIYPVSKYVLTQDWGGNHKGMDFAAPMGVSVVAGMSGKVVFAGWNSQGYGNLVIIEDGTFRLYEAHLSAFTVHVGDIVSQGTEIGRVGSTGNSTGPHVHFGLPSQTITVDGWTAHPDNVWTNGTASKGLMSSFSSTNMLDRGVTPRVFVPMLRR